MGKNSKKKVLGGIGVAIVAILILATFIVGMSVTISPFGNIYTYTKLADWLGLLAGCAACTDLADDRMLIAFGWLFVPVAHFRP